MFNSMHKSYTTKLNVKKRINYAWGSFFLNRKSKEHTLVVGQFKLGEQSKKKTKVNKPIELNQRKSTI